MTRILAAPYSIGPGTTPREGFGLVYAEGKILQFAPLDECRADHPGAEVLERSDCVLSPGFVNAHMHLYGVLAHGIIPPVPITSFKSFLEDYWWPLVENLLDARMIAAATRASALELIESGVTSLCDVLEAPLSMPGGLEAEAAVLDELGLRAIVSTEACERISPEVGRRGLEENASIVRSYAGHSRIEGMMCTHTSFTCSETFMRLAFRQAGALGVGLQFHLNESRYEPEFCLQARGMRSAEWYDRIGVLDGTVLAAQGVQLSANEIEILRKRGVRLVHVPLSNCEVGGGIASVPEMLAVGIVCGLGSDGYINDFFEVMRGAFLIHKGHREDPSVMAANTVWNMATEGGADALHPGRGYGRLAPGSPADFIVIDISDMPSPVSARNLTDQLLLFRSPKNVVDVVVAGEFLKKDGKLQSGDLGAARAESRREAARLWAQGQALAGKGRVGEP
jgi:cytosine/adenosine deaminase-related metal-dependent hydrolase